MKAESSWDKLQIFSKIATCHNMLFDSSRTIENLKKALVAAQDYDRE
jgi:hypothetical protein